MMSVSCSLLLVLACSLGGASALYSHGSGVVDLNPNNFDNRVKDSDGVWVVEFYAPWCGHCQSLAPEYQKAAKALKGFVGVGGVNCDDHKSLCGQFGVQGFPTIKIFGANKNRPQDYNVSSVKKHFGKSYLKKPFSILQGQRNAQGIVMEASKVAQQIVQDRLGGKSSSGGGGGGGGGSKDDVVELTESNFKKLVLDSDDMWLVEFFAPWCGHCKNLAPHWKKAATELKGKVKLGAVDATVHQSLAGQYGVQGYPTIKHFPAGSKKGAEEYDGGRTADDIVAWALERHEVNIEPPELVQVRFFFVTAVCCCCCCCCSIVNTYSTSFWQMFLFLVMLKS